MIISHKDCEKKGEKKRPEIEHGKDRLKAEFSVMTHYKKEQKEEEFGEKSDSRYSSSL